FLKLKKLIAGLLIASTFIFGILWVEQATKYVMTFNGFDNILVAASLFDLKNFERSWIASEYTDAILNDRIVYLDVQLVGSGLEEKTLAEVYADMNEKGGVENYLSPELVPDGRIRVYHTKIAVSNLQPEEIAHIRLNPAPLGETIHTTPENANVTLEIIDDELVLTNHEDYAIEMVEIKPNSPAHPATWIISIIVLTATIIIAVYPKLLQRKSVN
ncbi:MAG: hypothetical protein Q8P90_03550, partial [bacterium]|nr:hypothetical protein [bacterium]